jgi:hypothetical protein
MSTNTACEVRQALPAAGSSRVATRHHPGKP